MDELNGRMLAIQILLTGLIARVASEQRDAIGFLSYFRDEIKAVVAGVRLDGSNDSSAVRNKALETVDELFSLMKPPSSSNGDI
jgi:hypothetical protein